MTPTQPRKYVLQDLSVQEISLCDAGANASTDPRTGRKTQHALVALFKRDDYGDEPAAVRLRQLRKLTTRELFEEMRRMQSAKGKKKDAKHRREEKDDPGSQDVNPEGDAELALPLPQLQPNQLKSYKEQAMPKLKRILKGEVATSRALIEAAVIAKAAKIAKRENVTPEQAENQVWSQPGVREAYESIPAARQPKRAEQRIYKATRAEADLDARAKRRMKKNPGCSYAKAITDELDADPSLYTRYTEELAAGQTPYDMPENSQFLSPQGGDPLRMVNKDDDDVVECPECGEDDLDPGDAFCSACGADLSKAKSKRKARAS